MGISNPLLLLYNNLGVLEDMMKCLTFHPSRLDSSHLLQDIMLRPLTIQVLCAHLWLSRCYAPYPDYPGIMHQPLTIQVLCTHP